MELAQRRLVARVVRFGLVALAIVMVAGWFLRKVTPDRPVRIEMEASAAPQIGPGDVQVFNEDSTVDVILVGDRISAGLSPQLVEKIRGDITRSAERESTGLGGSIARMVTQTVADKIGTRVVYPLSEIDEIRYDRGRLMVRWRAGGEDQLLGSIRVDGDRASNRFSEAEATRLIEAVQARRNRF